MLPFSGSLNEPFNLESILPEMFRKSLFRNESTKETSKNFSLVKEPIIALLILVWKVELPESSDSTSKLCEVGIYIVSIGKLLRFIVEYFINFLLQLSFCDNEFISDMIQVQ